jgi:hypothetical protein
VGETDVEICSLQEPTSDSQKAHYFQWIQVQDWETGFFECKHWKQSFNFIAWGQSTCILHGLNQNIFGPLTLKFTLQIFL